MGCRARRAIFERPCPGPGSGLAAVCASASSDLRSVLSQVGDPRARRGVRHRLETVLVLAVGAVLAGTRSFVVVAEWAADLDPGTRAAAGLAGAVPSESTFPWVLAAPGR